MTDKQRKALLREAKHSMAIFMTSLGVNHYAASGFFVKWPDIADALVNGNNKQFFDDVGILVCLPMKAIAEALAAQNDSNSGKLITDAMESMLVDPCLAKAKLIAICNQEILKLKVANKPSMELIKGVNND